MERPSLQLYPADWRQNANLHRCTWAARGVWIELICLLHDQSEYGIIRWPLRDVASTLGAPIRLLQELYLKKVLKGCDSGLCSPLTYAPRHGGKVGAEIQLVLQQLGPIWYSSRLVRDEYIKTKKASYGMNNPIFDQPKGGIGTPIGTPIGTGSGIDNFLEPSRAGGRAPARSPSSSSSSSSVLGGYTPGAPSHPPEPLARAITPNAEDLQKGIGLGVGGLDRWPSMRAVLEEKTQITLKDPDLAREMPGAIVAHLLKFVGMGNLANKASARSDLTPDKFCALWQQALLDANTGAIRDPVAILATRLQLKTPKTKGRK